MKREIPVWVGVVVVLAALGVVGVLVYRSMYAGPSGPDVFQLDPRNPQNVALFRQLDEYYRRNPEKKPRNWPPPQFTEENIARAQEQHRREFEEAERRRARVILEYLQKSRQQQPK